MTYDQIIPYIIDKLKKYPDIKFEQTDNSTLLIHPRNENGFSLTLLTADQENTLYFGEAYHSHFENSEEQQNDLLDNIVFGLTGLARLKVWTKNKKPYKWSVEVKDEHGNWLDNGTTGLININFWTKSEFYYLQNDLLPIDKMQTDNKNGL